MEKEFLQVDGQLTAHFQCRVELVRSRLIDLPIDLQAGVLAEIHRRAEAEIHHFIIVKIGVGIDIAHPGGQFKGVDAAQVLQGVLSLVFQRAVTSKSWKLISSLLPRKSLLKLPSARPPSISMPEAR